MNVVIIHYHLNPGGVTQVVGNHLRALSASGQPLERVLVLHGGRTSGWQAASSGLEQRVALQQIPGLEYDDRQAPASDGDSLASELEACISRHGCLADETVVHVHNHALGKSAALPVAVARLAQRGYRLLLQIHDFAEDFRPANYHHLATALADEGPDAFPGIAYPQSEHVHYAVLNRRDFDILSVAGVTRERLHYLPNPVVGITDLDSAAERRKQTLAGLGLDGEARLIVYPVRGIRRKNVGEMLLCAALVADGSFWAITLAPQTDVEKRSFDKWQALAAQTKLRCLFDIGGKYHVPFADGIAAAEALLTTSVAEGFGMGLLEAWLAEKPLIGRDLPEITVDFVEAGVQFPHLRESLQIPLDWVGRRTVAEALATAFRQALDEFGRRAPEIDIDRSIEQLVSDDTIDFARLTTPLQASVIGQVVDSSAARATIDEHNPGLRDILELDAQSAQATIASNREAVFTKFSGKAVGAELGRIYRAVLSSPTGSVEPLRSAGKILDQFLDIRRLHPLRLDS